MQIISWHPGDVLSGVTQHMAERWSDGAQQTDAPAGYTAWDAAGNQTASRALTAEEAARLAAQSASITADNNRQTLQQRAQAALAANATYLAIASPTAAQVAAQTGRNTRAISGVIRLLLGQLDDTSGT